jgi:hypothetical protein
MKQWAELCIDAGLPIRELDLFETYMAGTAISRKLQQFQGEHRDFNALSPEQQAMVREAAYAAIPSKLKGK